MTILISLLTNQTIQPAPLSIKIEVLSVALGEPKAVVLLDLSASFDTINYHTLERLESGFHLSEKLLSGHKDI